MSYDTEFTDFAVCPWCGYEERDTWELFPQAAHSEEVCETDCGNCGRPIVVIEHIEVSYTTIKGEES